MAITVIDEGKAIRFERAARALQGRTSNDRFVIRGQVKGRRYRLIHKERDNLYDGFYGEWKPLTKEDNRGESLPGAQKGNDGLLHVGDLIVAWQPEESAALRDDIILYQNYVNANAINFVSDDKITVDKSNTGVTNKLMNTSIKSAAGRMLEQERRRAVEAAVTRGEVQLSERTAEKLQMEHEMKELQEQVAFYENKQPTVSVPVALEAQAVPVAKPAKPRGRKPNKNKITTAREPVSSS